MNFESRARPPRLHHHGPTCPHIDGRAAGVLFGSREPWIFAACLFPATIMGTSIRTLESNLMREQQEDTGSVVALLCCLHGKPWNVADAQFDGVRFNETAFFRGILFAGNASLHRSRFEESAQFTGAKLQGLTDFSDASFEDYADLVDVQFMISANFKTASSGKYRDAD